MTDKPPVLRLHVFAGPNGSGKSTIIQNVREHKVNGRSLDFGVYINADDIAAALREKRFDFRKYNVKTNLREFRQIALESGLVGKRFPEDRFRRSFVFAGGKVRLRRKDDVEALAQIIADFLRKKLLREKKKISFETVFSHPGKLDFMREARAAGYKVYLYFVATESPEINIARVKKRAMEGGHDVPQEKIRSRYFRSLDLLFDAAELAYQTYFFDNSGDRPVLAGHLKIEKEGRKWDGSDIDTIPVWLLVHYFGKIRQR